MVPVPVIAGLRRSLARALCADCVVRVLFNACVMCLDDCRKIAAYTNLGSAPALVPTSALKLLYKRHFVTGSESLSQSNNSATEEHSDVDVPRAEAAERTKEPSALPRHPQLAIFVKQLSKLRKSESKSKQKRGGGGGGGGGRSISKKSPAEAVVGILLQCAADGTFDQLVQSLLFLVEEKNDAENGGSTADPPSMSPEKRARIVAADSKKKSKTQKKRNKLLHPINWIGADTLANMCGTFFSIGSSADSAASSTTGVSVSSRGRSRAECTGCTLQQVHTCAPIHNKPFSYLLSFFFFRVVDSGTFLSIFVLPFVSQLRQPMVSARVNPLPSSFSVGAC